MKEVIFVLLNEFADWEGAFIAACLNQGVMPGSPVPYKVKTLVYNQRACLFNRGIQSIA